MERNHEPLNLSAHETSFLCWLSENGGSGARSGNKWIGSADRLIEAGYVKDRTDPSRPDTVHYMITLKGAEALKPYRDLLTRGAESSLRPEACAGAKRAR